MFPWLFSIIVVILHHPYITQHLYSTLTHVKGKFVWVRQWNKKTVNFLLDHGLRKSKADPCIFTCTIEGDGMILPIYVDDGLLVDNNMMDMDKLFRKLQNAFEITYKEAESFIDLQITRDENNRRL